MNKTRSTFTLPEGRSKSVEFTDEVVRDVFAAVALGLASAQHLAWATAGQPLTYDTNEAVARNAYDLADALMAERQSRLEARRQNPPTTTG